MPAQHDGPQSPNFKPIPLKGNVSPGGLAKAPVSGRMKALSVHAPTGACTSWGIPFDIGRAILLNDRPVFVDLAAFKAQWLVFMHTTDIEKQERNEHGLFSPTSGAGRLNEHVADYVICYEDGAESRFEIRRRHQICMVSGRWGENCFQAVTHQKPAPVTPSHEQALPANWSYGQMKDARIAWGYRQTRAAARDDMPWRNWLCAWENPRPGKAISGLRLEPLCGTVLLSAISAGKASSMPLRWESRRKALLRLPGGVEFDSKADEAGALKQIGLDLGQLISVRPRTSYPNETWARTSDNEVPEVLSNELLVEYTAHRDARFHLWDGKTVPVTKLEGSGKAGALKSVAEATQRVRIRVVDKRTKRPVAVKLHIHGEDGEYLPPNDRHRIVNPSWFEDYSTDFAHQGTHFCTYIPGDTMVNLPVGTVYVEVSKGFEVKPFRKVLRIKEGTRQVTLTVDRVLPWRERGWVTADTHVHFLSPQTALLEGAAEGVNVVNLLASQWGELMTNVGDFDGKSTFGAKESGGDGEYLVRVGTENRQHVMGHISLLGYSGNIIAPMTTGGPDESAIGDPIEVLLTEWARQCKRQGGLVVLPHFPNPRAEHAATIVTGDADALEMTSWGDHYSGIDPYSLSDWYRYLNCGYFVPAVGGTDKMSAQTAVGTVRTYARIHEDAEFDYANWMEAVRSGNTFVTYGPLLELAVEGKAPGARIHMKRNGGTLGVEWHVASATLPMSRVDLVVNGEIRESKRVKAWADEGQWNLSVGRSSWIALLVRGQHRGKPEMIAAHSSPVMVNLERSSFFAAADALTILEQIEGALAYLDTVGTRAEVSAYKRMRLVLTSAHRDLHNRMHRRGHGHNHAPGAERSER